MIRTYTISELELMSGFTRRTISDYIAKGILAGPSHRGRGARYPQSDVDVLQLVPRIRTLMKKEFPDLKSISSFLRHLSNHDLSHGESLQRKGPGAGSQAAKSSIAARSVTTDGGAGKN